MRITPKKNLDGSTYIQAEMTPEEYAVVKTALEDYFSEEYLGTNHRIFIADMMKEFIKAHEKMVKMNESK